MKPPTDYLFAYGLLLDEAPAAELLVLFGTATHVGRATALGVMYDAGAYPAAVEGDGVLHGKVIGFPSAAALAILDKYEGVDHQPPLYNRGRTVATLDDGRKLDCWIYRYARDTSKLRRIDSGRWGEQPK